MNNERNKLLKRLNENISKHSGTTLGTYKTTEIKPLKPMAPLKPKAPSAPSKPERPKAPKAPVKPKRPAAPKFQPQRRSVPETNEYEESS